MSFSAFAVRSAKVVGSVLISGVVATLLTIFGLPLCLKLTGSTACVPPIDWLIPVLTSFGSEGGAPGVFAIVWLDFFLAIIAILLVFIGARGILRREQERRAERTNST